MWELEYKGVRKSFANWGLCGLNVQKISSAADSVSFVASSARFDSVQQFEYDEKIIVWRGTTRFFSGRITTPPRFGSAAVESLSYTARGPWAELEETVYEQLWRSYGADVAPTTVILGKAQSNVRISCGAQIKDLLDYAISQGTSLSYKESDLAMMDITPPESEATDITVAAAILQMLNWHKDITTWFDYAGETPVLRFSRRSSAPAGVIHVNQGAPNESIRITRRDDLMLRGVVINYSINKTVNGRSYFGLVTDSAGETSGRRVMKSTVDLEGYSYEKLTQTVKNDLIPYTTGSYDGIGNYLRSKCPWLGSADVETFEWSDQKVDNPSDLPRLLTEGNIQDWMDKESGSGTISANVKVTYKNGSVMVYAVSSTEVFTDAESRTYSKRQNYEAGEQIPQGLAQKIFSQLQMPQFQGDFSLLEPEVFGVWHPGLVLNLAGGLTEWTSMRAQIQQVHFDIDEGRTVITFGPAEHLSPQDFTELLRVNRVRKKTTLSTVRATGETATAASVVELSGPAPKTVVSSASTASVKAVIANPADEQQRKVVIDPTADSFKKGKALVVDPTGKSTTWGDAMPPVGESDKEEMHMLLRWMPSDENQEILVLKPLWGWPRMTDEPETPPETVG